MRSIAELCGQCQVIITDAPDPFGPIVAAARSGSPADLALVR
ncbi:MULTISPECIES: hypothetical protein [unclassified Nonomuraea]